MNINGQRQAKQPSKKDKIKELEIQVQNLHMALQMSNMLVKHISDQFKVFQNDLGSSMGMLNDLQYRTISMLNVGNFDKDLIEKEAESLKLKDFADASDKEDTIKGYINDDSGVINEDSVVIITTSTPDVAEDQGIFRSKFPMSECLTPNLREKLLGLAVGASVEVEIYGVKHNLTILGLRKKEQPEVQKEN